jgi:hypothetical protein
MVILKTAKLFLIHMTDVAQLAFTIAPSARFVGFPIDWDNPPQYAPFVTLRGTRATAKRNSFNWLR